MHTDLILIHTHARLGDARGNAPRFCPTHQRTIEPRLSTHMERAVRSALEDEGYNWCAFCQGWHK